MQALIALKNFITARPTVPAVSGTAPSQAEVALVTDHLLDELLSSITSVKYRRSHVQLYQRALQRLASAVAGFDNSANLVEVVYNAISFVRDQFPNWFNWDEPALRSATLEESFRSFLSAVTQNCASPLLLAIFTELESYLESGTATWRHQVLITDLVENKIGKYSRNFDGFAICVRYNLHDTGIQKLLLDYLQAEIDNARNPAGKIHHFTNEINALAVSPFLLGAGLSLKQHLLNSLSNQLAFIETAGPASHATAHPAVVPKIYTQLSVAQFAAFLRLVIDTRVITCPNQREFLSFMATHLRTTNAATISPQSFRNKYYGPEPPALSAAKDICITMLNHARKMAH